MKTFLAILGIVFAAILIIAIVKTGNLTSVKETTEGFLGVNLPDRCISYDQIASRSTKDLIKAAPGKVYSFTVVSSSSLTRYFQIYDQSNATLGGVGVATPSFVIPISAKSAAEVPGLVDHTFSSPLALTASGIFFGISTNYANYSAVPDSANNYSVQACYE